MYKESRKLGECKREFELKKKYKSLTVKCNVAQQCDAETVEPQRFEKQQQPPQFNDESFVPNELRSNEEAGLNCGRQMGKTYP